MWDKLFLPIVSQMSSLYYTSYLYNTHFVPLYLTMWDMDIFFLSCSLLSCYDLLHSMGCCSQISFWPNCTKGLEDVFYPFSIAFTLSSYQKNWQVELLQHRVRPYTVWPNFLGSIGNNINLLKISIIHYFTLAFTLHATSRTFISFILLHGVMEYISRVSIEYYNHLCINYLTLIG